MRSGNSHSLAYVGAVPLPRPGGGESFGERFDRFAQFFVAELERYARVDFALVTAPRRSSSSAPRSPSAASRSAGWRTSAYETSRRVRQQAGRDPEGRGRVRGGRGFQFVSLPRVRLEDAVAHARSAPRPLDRKDAPRQQGGRRVQLLDISAGSDANYPVRLAFYESPAGFAPTLATVRLKEELVYAEERLDERGARPAPCASRTATASRGGRTPARPTRSVDARREEPLGDGVVDLGTSGAQALVFAWRRRRRPAAGVLEHRGHRVRRQDLVDDLDDVRR